jgi:lipopolysaccharide heptosyltransferase I
MASLPRSVLVIKPSSFGDIVQALPVLAALRQAWPGARIDWLVKPEWAGLLEGHPLIDQLLLLPRALAPWLQLLTRLRAAGYDLVIDLQGLLRSGLLSRITAAPVRIGFADGREGSPWCYTHRVRIQHDAAHAVERYLELIRSLGVAAGDAVTFPLPEWQEEQRWAKCLLAAAMPGEPKVVCVIHPAARWKTKQWPAERYAELADWLIARKRYLVVLIGGKDQADQVSHVINRMRERPLNLVARTTLAQLAVLLRQANLVVTNDSGPMHLAAAVGAPVVAIFGPTDPRKVGPFGPGHFVLKKTVDCSRCRRNRCVQDLSCLKAITIEEVEEAVELSISRNVVHARAEQNA